MVGLGYPESHWFFDIFVYPSAYLLLMNVQIDLKYSLCLDGGSTLGLNVFNSSIWVVDSIVSLDDIRVLGSWTP